MRPVFEDFFMQDPVVCARDLIGSQFVWHGCAGRIVETEALIAAGPGRLTRAFGIDGAVHGRSFLREPNCGIFRDTVVDAAVGPRIGISRAVDLMWRFGDPASVSLSRRF